MPVQDIKFLWVKNTSAMAGVIRELATSPPEDRPDDVSALEAMMTRHGVEFEWPNGRPSVIQYNDMADDVLSISLPSVNAIDNGAEVAQTLSVGPYPIDAGYDLIYSGERKPTISNADHWEEIYRTRLGDYTIGKCM